MDMERPGDATDSPSSLAKAGPSTTDARRVADSVVEATTVATAATVPLGHARPPVGESVWGGGQAEKVEREGNRPATKGR